MSHRCATCGAVADASGCVEHPGAPLAVDAGDDPLFGATIDHRFVVLGRLGKGGMGVIYRAWQLSTGREVAVKVLEKLDSGAMARFRREARVTAGLHSPHIVTVFDTGTLAEGQPYLVMELLRGQSLAEALDAGELASSDAAPIGAQICLALAEAHAAGVVHRDLKPGNVMIERLPDGKPFVRVLDFGLAKLTERSDQSVVTHAHATPGTPAYMSPEQIRGQDVGPATDLYAVGLILFELATGQRAYPEPSIPAIFTRKLLEPPPKLVDPRLRRLDAVLARCLAQDSAARPTSAEELRVALETLEDASVAPPPILAETLDGPLETAPPSPESRAEPAAVDPAPVAPESVAVEAEIAPPVAAGRSYQGALVVLGVVLLAGVGWLIVRPPSASTEGGSAPATAAPATAAPATAVPATVSSATAAPATAATVTAMPVSTAPATVAPATAASKAAPTPRPVARPTVRIGRVQTTGMDPSVATRVLRQTALRARGCGLRGSARFSLFVNGRGVVTRVTLDPRNACVRKRLHETAFPALTAGFATVRGRLEVRR